MMFLPLLFASLAFLIARYCTEYSQVQVSISLFVFVLFKMLLWGLCKINKWMPISGSDLMTIAEQEKSPTNVLAFYFMNGGDEKLVRKNWEETIMSKPKQFERYMCIVKKIPFLGYVFVKDDIDLKRNIFLSPDNENVRTKADFEEICAKRSMEPLSFDKPLFELEVFTKFSDEAEAGKTIIMFRVHHVIGDGIGLSTTLATQTKEGEGIFMTPKRKAKIFPMPVFILIAIGFVHKLIMLMLSRGDKNMFMGTLKNGVGKRVCALSKPISLNVVKEIRQKHPSTTLNDVVMTAIGSTFHKYMITRLRNENPTKSIDELLSMLPEYVTANMPINMRPQLETSPPKLQNKYTFLFVKLPVSSPDRFDRLAKTQQILTKLKTSVAPIVHYVCGKLAVDVLPHFLAESLMTFCGDKCTVMLTNVPGPQGDKIKLQGRTIESLGFFIPKRNKCVMGISVVTTYGYLRLGLMIDEVICSDPHTFVDMFEEEMHLLNASTNDNTKNNVNEEAN
eukprot:TRINITY_DN4758_c0_g1_i1.p1 TRINITY_DN4758_c0_g1~~TRINITY_DN4758_c0_g1_i1.p1  ORF type:complete len:506 (+),score=118.45 TRINITY_DN4758_c0_g1_i1:156-1673(+)